MRLPNLLFAAAALAIFSVTLSEAASISVVVNDFTTVIKKRNYHVKKDESLGAFTDSILRHEKDTRGLDYEGSDGGVVRIHHLGNQLVILSDTEMKAYGWCFRINGEIPELMPDKIGPLRESDEIEWFYAYAWMRDGKWVQQCRPLGREDLPEPENEGRPFRSTRKPQPRTRLMGNKLRALQPRLAKKSFHRGTRQ